MSDRHPATIQALRWFAFDHLKGKPREVSQACAELAYSIAADLPDDPELTVGLRKLLEAKDCFVRASLASLKD